jgi:hypothetical protein
MTSASFVPVYRMVEKVLQRIAALEKALYAMNLLGMVEE